MRNLKYFLFLCALGLAPTPGCTVNATSGDGFGGEWYASFESGGTSSGGVAAVSSGGASTAAPGAAGSQAVTVAAGATSTSSVAGAPGLGGAPSAAGSSMSPQNAGSPTVPGSAGASTGTAGTSSTGTTYTTANCPTAAAMTPPAPIADITAACVKCLYTTGCADAVDCHNEPGCAAATLKALECMRLTATYWDIPYENIPEEDAKCEIGKGVGPSPVPAEVKVLSTDPTAWVGADLSLFANAAPWYNNCFAECLSPPPPQ